MAVVADHRTDEGGEPRPKAPTGGKERPDMTARRGHQGRHFEATNPVTTDTTDSGPGRYAGMRGAAAGQQSVMSDEPDAFIGHVRVCGGGPAG
jgi:hypothetical protein